MNIIINTKSYEGIPYNEYSRLDIDQRGLVFVQHGFESNKNRGADYIAINLARLGYKVVAIDAYKHGDRISEPFISQPEYERFKEAFNIIDQTGDDLKKLYDDLFKDIFPEFDFIGISMGGMIAYNLAMKTKRIRKLIPVISTPILYEFAEWLVDRENNESYKDKLHEVKGFVESIDPLNNQEKLYYKKLHILNTTKDTVVPAMYSEKYYKKSDDPNITFTLYEDKHNVNRRMQEDILMLISEEKVVL